MIQPMPPLHADAEVRAANVEFVFDVLAAVQSKLTGSIALQQQVWQEVADARAGGGLGQMNRIHDRWIRMSEYPFEEEPT